MEKGDLWDDSALITAFDEAVSKFKTMHGIGGRGGLAEVAKLNTSEAGTHEVVSKSSEVGSNVGHVEADYNKNTASNATVEIGKTGNPSLVEENPSGKSLFSQKNIVSSTMQNGNLSPIKESPKVQTCSPKKHIGSSNVQNVQAGDTWYSQSPEEYNQLLNKYYELESQRQNILQQLNQFSSWSYQYPVSNTFTSEYNQASVPQSSYQTVTCYCPYGCQSLVTCCSSLPAHCSDAACADKIHDASRGGSNENSASQEDHKFVKTAVVSVERALSSLTKETFQNANASINGGKEKDLSPEFSHLTESTESGTDLAVVLNAWYSAGFYTGKYISEKSLEKKRCG